MSDEINEEGQYFVLEYCTHDHGVLSENNFVILLYGYIKFRNSENVKPRNC